MEFIKKRFRNKAFLVSLFSAVMLLAQQLGIKVFPDNAADVFNTVLLILTLLGIVIDPTTPGISDK